MISIDGVFYDVSRFNHPGGKLVLQNLAGRDATTEFRLFHDPGTQIRLKGHPASGVQNKKMLEFLELEKHMRDIGLFKSTPIFYIERALILVSLFVTAISWRVHAPVFSAVCLGFFWQQLAFVGHDVGHSSVSGRETDSFYGTLFGNTLGGISLEWWKHGHYVHHVSPNDVEKDPDIQHLPVMAVDEKMLGFYSSFHEKWFHFTTLAKLLVARQIYLFYPIMSVARFNLYAQSLIYSLKRGSWLDLLSLFAFYGWYIALVLSGNSRLMYIYVSHAVTGLLHVQICISHFAEQIDAKGDWVDRQSLTTIDVDCPSWMDWFHGGLQFQLEHHLFPRLPRENLRKASELLQPFFERHNVRCVRLGFVQCNRRVLRKLAGTSDHALLVDAINLRG